MLIETRAVRQGWVVVGSGLALACSTSSSPTSVTPPPPAKVSIVFDME